LGYEYTNKERHERKEAERRLTLREEAFGDAPLAIGPSDEYTIGVIHAIETNTPYRFNATVEDTGLITNLPDGYWVEAPCLVDNMGIHPCFVGDLPPQCAALNRNRMNQDELAVKAALEGDRRAAEQAVALEDGLDAALDHFPLRSEVIVGPLLLGSGGCRCEEGERDGREREAFHGFPRSPDDRFLEPCQHAGRTRFRPRVRRSRPWPGGNIVSP